MPLLMCPNCSASMQALNRNSVEFDMCPTCRGVWLDRGELEKLLAAGREDDAGNQAQDQERPSRIGYEPRSQARPEGRRGSDDDDDDYRPKKRRSSFFDIFD